MVSLLVKRLKLILLPDDGVTQIPVTIDLDEIKVTENPEHKKQIKLNDELMMEMRYPSLDQFIKNNFDINESNFDQSFELIVVVLIRFIVRKRFGLLMMSVRKR